VNWYRTVYEAIVERELADPKPNLPLGDLKAFVEDGKHAGRVRRLALALCETLSPGFSAPFIARSLDDPEFRGDAVDAALARGEQALASGDSEAAREAFRKAFDHARAADQCVKAADQLTRLGETVDTRAHLGLVVDWRVVGPFDAPQFTGFDKSFPPEDKVDLSARYSGVEGRELAWMRYQTADPLGLVNLAEPLGPAKDAVGYCYAELDFARDQAAELRCGADDNCTVWLNGQKVFGRKQWLNGIRLDRFTTNVQVRAGINRLLVKVCQGPQHVDPAVPNNWSLQLRFCEPDGGGIRFRSALPTKETK
jgi:hypothetical protein